jgi:hypothetical protein
MVFLKKILKNILSQFHVKKSDKVYKNQTIYIHTNTKQ